MKNKPKLLVFAGSTRKDSYNKKLARLAEKLLRAQDADVTYIDLRDFPMPLYDGDLEEAHGIPETALQFRAILQQHQGFLISAPEYNSNISAVLKNAIDWASRPRKGEADLLCFNDKVICLCSASPGKWGGLRGLVSVRSIFGNIGSIVLPGQFCLPFADKAFAENGDLADATSQKILNGLCQSFIAVTEKMMN